MSKHAQKCENLPKLQKKILLCLAKEGPLNISKTNTKLSGENTSTNRAMHELEKKSLVIGVDAEPYKGRVFPKYWLTVKGIMLAIMYDANPELIKRHILSVSDENKEAVEDLFDLVIDVPDLMKPFAESYYYNGKIVASDFLIRLLPHWAKFDKKKFQALKNAINKNSHYVDKSNIDIVIEKLNELKKGQ